MDEFLDFAVEKNALSESVLYEILVVPHLFLELIVQGIGRQELPDLGALVCDFRVGLVNVNLRVDVRSFLGLGCFLVRRHLDNLL